MTRNGPTPEAAELRSTDTPQEDGERLVSYLRIVLAVVIVLFLVGYVLHMSETGFLAFHWSGVATLLWALMSALYLTLIKRGSYRPWMSYLSTVIDLTVFTIFLVVSTAVLPLQFAHGPAPMLYFLVIGLAALRRSRKLVLFSGIASAAALLAVSAVGAWASLGTGQALLVIDGRAMDFNIVDQAGKALTLAFTAGVIGHVTGALRRSEHRYRQLFENAPDGIVIVAGDQRIVTANHRFAEIAGREREAVIGWQIGELLGGGPLGRATPHGGVLGSPSSVIRPDGARVPVRTVALPVTYQGSECVELSVRDVGEQTRLERELAQSQKMETIGRLAGGLARDFNEILSGVIDSATRAERSARDIGDPSARDRLGRQVAMIKDCGASAQEVVGRLLGFSGTGMLDAEPIDLGQIVRDVARICRNTFGEHYAISVETPSDPAPADGDGTSLTQALLNLCINARDAMPAGGSIALRLTDRRPDPDVLSTLPSADTTAAFWCIETTDEGSGMAPDTIDKIFDPFFTTKPPGQGTGLGLSMVYNIVRQHGGAIDVKSRPGAGSCFRLFLARSTRTAGGG